MDASRRVHLPGSDGRTVVNADVRAAIIDLAQRSRADSDRVANVTRETAAGSSTGRGASAATAAPPAGGAMSDRLAVMKERLAVLEDAFAKSELDRSMVYDENERLKVELQRSVEEKSVLLHDMRDSEHRSGQVHFEEERLVLAERMQLLEKERDAAVTRTNELETTIKRMNRERARLLRETDGVSVADLHYSNERLSAQLTKLHQLQARTVAADEAKVASCESAISAISSDMQALEQRLLAMQQQHAFEKGQWQQQFDRQAQEFNLERMETDKLVGILGTKLEAALAESQLLKNQVALMSASSGGGSIRRSAHR